MDAELEESKSSRGGSVGGVRVEWNVTGTVLSTAGDDARVRLWKCESSSLDLSASLSLLSKAMKGEGRARS